MVRRNADGEQFSRNASFKDGRAAESDGQSARPLALCSLLQHAQHQQFRQIRLNKTAHRIVRPWRQQTVFRIRRNQKQERSSLLRQPLNRFEHRFAVRAAEHYLQHENVHAPLRQQAKHFVPVAARRQNLDLLQPAKRPGKQLLFPGRCKRKQ